MTTNKIIENIKSLCEVKFLPVSEFLMSYALKNENYPNFYLFQNLTISNGTEFFENDEYYWISSIEIYIAPTNILISLESMDNDGNAAIINLNSRKKVKMDEVITFDVSSITKRVSLKLINATDRIEIRRIKINGFNYKSTIDIINNLDRLWKIVDKNELTEVHFLDDELAKKKTELDLCDKTINISRQNIEKLEQAYAFTQSQLDSTRKYLNNSMQELELTQSKIESGEQKNIEINDILHDLNVEKNRLTGEVNNEKINLDETLLELRKYKKESALYSEDFSAYKSEINKQQMMYIIILAIVSISMIIITHNIYNSAASLVDNYQFNFDLWTLIASRLPLISINIVIMGILSSLLYYLINAITMNFNKVSAVKQIAYLVKECVESQSSDIPLKNEELLKIRMNSKMDLIKAYLKVSEENGS